MKKRPLSPVADLPSPGRGLLLLLLLEGGGSACLTDVELHCSSLVHVEFGLYLRDCVDMPSLCLMSICACLRARYLEFPDLPDRILSGMPPGQQAPGKAVAADACSR